MTAINVFMEILIVLNAGFKKLNTNIDISFPGP
jgi:hypothetical protein